MAHGPMLRHSWLLPWVPQRSTHLELSYKGCEMGAQMPEAKRSRQCNLKLYYYTVRATNLYSDMGQAPKFHRKASSTIKTPGRGCRRVL